MAASMTESAWPAFIAPPLSSPRTVNSCWAALSISSALTSSLDLPVSRLPNPSAARPAMPAPRPASLALRAAPPRLMSLTSPSSMTAGALSAPRMPRPPACQGRAGADVELQRGVQRRRRMRCAVDVGDAHAVADRRDDAVDLVERQRRGGKHGRPVGVANGVAELRGDDGPARI